MLATRLVFPPSDALAQLTAAVQAATPEQCPALLGQLEALKASLWLKMTTGAPAGSSSQDDQLLTAEEVADRLRVTKAFVYRNAHSYPFTIHQGRYVRFSKAGLERYLTQRQGRTPS